MDKNTLIGLGLIGLILVVFTFYNQPSGEELDKLIAQQEQADKAAKEKADKRTDNKETEANKVSVIDTLSLSNDSIVSAPLNTIISSQDAQEETYFLENNKIKVILTNKGGGVKSVFLKEYQTYTDFAKNKEGKEINPLELFNESVATNGLIFSEKDKEINTKEIAFQLDKQTEEYISFIANFGEDKTIEQIYYITPDQYHINYEVKLNGFGEVKPNTVLLDWRADLLKTERLLSEQRRLSTVFFKSSKGKYDYLSEMSDDEEKLEADAEWVAFKQSYFSSVMMPKSAFLKEGSFLKIHKIGENTEKDSTHIKSYTAVVNLGLSNTNSATAEIKWYFGPNDYDILSSYQNGSEDIINYGWGLFRWLNIYIIQPIFVWLANFGINLGIAILLLTIIIKLVLTPIQWKMYASSAKMRILKPEIDELNKKYPNKEDAMKKQMEMMTLYKESGASPLAGCVPMLIQMPLLFAVFRFFPATFTLRQQGFLWAEDLSSYDSVWDFGFHIPLYGDHVSLFTLLMAITTFFYTILNNSTMAQPTQPGMPNMKIIMYIFPFMMIFFFNNYSSGLSFYYFISTLMSILTMIMIKKFFVDEEKLKAKMAAKKADAQQSGKKAGKSKFQERLEQMQKAQQEKLKNRK
ncbi:MAG: membrane protein insertase YidC [Brumimicrobium sp.]|nr:membrane protein insertase YidC [Brumimicrobium sp.]